MRTVEGWIDVLRSTVDVPARFLSTWQIVRGSEGFRRRREEEVRTRGRVPGPNRSRFWREAIRLVAFRPAWPSLGGLLAVAVLVHVIHMDPSTRLAARAEERAAVIRARIEAARRTRAEGEPGAFGEEGRSSVPSENTGTHEEKDIDEPLQEAGPPAEPNLAEEEEAERNLDDAGADAIQSTDTDTSSEEEEAYRTQDTKDMEEKLFGLRNRRVEPEERVLRPPPLEELMEREEEIEPSSLQGTPASQTNKNKAGTQTITAESSAATAKLAANPTSFLRRGQGKTASSAHMVASPAKPKPAPTTPKGGKTSTASKRRLSRLAGKQTSSQGTRSLAVVSKEGDGTDQVQAGKKGGGEIEVEKTAPITIGTTSLVVNEDELSQNDERAHQQSLQGEVQVRAPSETPGKSSEALVKDEPGIMDSSTDWVLNLDEALEDISKALALLQRGFAKARATLQDHPGFKRPTE